MPNTTDYANGTINPLALAPDIYEARVIPRDYKCEVRSMICMCISRNPAR